MTDDTVSPQPRPNPPEEQKPPLSVFSDLLIDLSNPAGATVDWLVFFPRSDSDTRVRLAALTAAFARLDRNPALLPLWEHCEALRELGCLVLAVTGDATLTTPRPLQFRHAGVQCNCILFEFSHRVIYAAERFLVLASKSDVGGPAFGATDGADNTELEARMATAGSLVGLLNAAVAWNRNWTDALPPATGRTQHMRQLLLYVRAYGLWCGARHALGPRLRTCNLAQVSGPRINSLRSARLLLVEAFRTLSGSRDKVELAGGLLCLSDECTPNFAFQTEYLNASERRTHEALVKSKDNTRRGSPWHANVTALMLHVMAEYHASVGETGVAVGVLRTLVRHYDSHGDLEEWEKLASDTGQRVPSSADLTTLWSELQGSAAMRKGKAVTGREPMRLRGIQ